MKVDICDICRAEGKLSYASHRISAKNRITRVAIDACKDHKDTFKKLGSFDKCKKFAEDLITNPKCNLRVDLLFKK